MFKKLIDKVKINEVTTEDSIPKVDADAFRDLHNHFNCKVRSLKRTIAQCEKAKRYGVDLDEYREELTKNLESYKSQNQKVCTFINQNRTTFRVPFRMTADSEGGFNLVGAYILDY